jgi:8-amino-7-oxononanoate synthase
MTEQTMHFLGETLADLEGAGRRRVLRPLDGMPGTTVQIGGRDCVCLCSNNYLSLASRPEVIGAAARAVEELGCGAGASRLVAGNMALHEELEAAIARLKHQPAAILFPTGYMANVGAISALVSSGDAVVVDKLNHASIIDGCRLSGARMLVYRHCDADRLDEVLSRAGGYRRKLLVTDGVFSMDGHIAPLPEIAEACARHGAMLMIDEAHATGVIGPSGRGTQEHFGIVESRMPEPTIVMGTLSKAVGSLGGFVAGSRELIDYLKNTARSFIYTTALPPSVCAASLAAIKLIENDPQPLEKLRENTRLLAGLLEDMRPAGGGAVLQPWGQTPIFPVHIGEAVRAVAISRELLEAGYLCPAIRPPTVPSGTSRLRVSLQADHTHQQIHGFADALRRFMKMSV